MTTRILASNPECEIILMIMNSPVGVHLQKRPLMKKYYNMYRSVAKDEKLRLIDHSVNWAKVQKKPDLYKRYIPDGLHPNVLGCQKVISPEIRTAIGL